MPLVEIEAFSVKDAVQAIVPYLEDTSSSAYNSINFNGWHGLGASAVLRTIAEHPPPSLRKKFDKIIHIDCSRWKSRRVLQRAIASELKLSPDVMAAFDRKDEEDDYSKVDEGSRAEIEDVTREIYQTISDLSCLVILHNGSARRVDLADFGFHQHYRFSPKSNKLLWTFGMEREVDKSHLDLLIVPILTSSRSKLLIDELLMEEARDAVKHMQHQESIAPGTAARCLSYLFWLATVGGGVVKREHASNYWVCDGIIEGGELDESWEVSVALQQQIRIRFLYGIEGRFGSGFSRDTLPWKLTYWYGDAIANVDTKLTSFFLGNDYDWPIMFQLPSDMFRKSERLRVLELSQCEFSFFSPPFHCCRSLRLLGLDRCKDVTKKEERKKGNPALEFFGHLWVLHITNTDWDLELPHNIMQHMAMNIRDVHIQTGRIWHNHFAWRRLQNLRKLRVINPTRSWETGNKDEFTDMAKLELLDLSENTTIKVLPSLSTATGLKTLVLDDCAGLDHIGPEGLPPSLESFTFYGKLRYRGSINPEACDKLSKISMEGCVHLERFKLRGLLLDLVELNLSGTSVKKVDLSSVPYIKRVFMMGCKKLRAIMWEPGNWGVEWRVEVLCIDTTERTKGRGQSLSDSSSLCIQNTKYDSFVIATDVRIVQSLIFYPNTYGNTVAITKSITKSLYLDLHVVPPSSSKGSSSYKIFLNPCCYKNVLLEEVVAYDDEITWPLPLDCHIEIGEGIRVAGMASKAIEAFGYMMAQYFKSLHMHDNSSIIGLPCASNWQFNLKWWRVERCPELQVLFVPYNRQIRYEFKDLRTIWASDLAAAACIWSKRTIHHSSDNFEALQSIYLHNCPRLKFVLPFSRFTLPSLETLHISHCGDLRQVFPWDVDVPKEDRQEDTVKEFPKLKHIHLHELTSLQEICKAKMSASMLERVWVRGCWALRRLPAVSHLDSHRAVVDCEKNWWEKLKWDGLHAGHHPSLYEPQHSSYYKKRLLRGTVLR